MEKMPRGKYSITMAIKWSLFWWAALAMSLAAQAEKTSRPFPEPPSSDHALADQVISLALENQFHGRYKADLELVQESYLRGLERLSGTIQVNDTAGDRIIEVRNGDTGFLYRSESNGQFQWITDLQTQRIRRIANRQWKKPALGSVLSYEDLVRMPMDILKQGNDYKDFRQSDSSYELTLTLKHSSGSFYSRAVANLSKSPLLLRSMILYDNQGKRCKQVEAMTYTEVGGKWLLNRFRVTNCDSSAATWVAMKNPVLPDMTGLAQGDHAWSAPKPLAQPRPALRVPELRPLPATPGEGQVQSQDLEAEPTVDD